MFHLNLASKNLLVALVVGLLLVGVIALPALAQTATPTPDPNNLVLVVGALDLSGGQIKVGGYVIVPGTALPPVPLQQGDIVIITGYLQPDGITIHAVTFELFVEPEQTPTATMTWTPTVTPQFTATPFTQTPTATTTATQTPIPTLTATFTPCDFPNHPVALRIAEAFSVPYEEVIAFHCAGFGFGEITRAYLLATQTGETAQYYLELKASGLGWGQIVRDTGIHPSELAPGQVHRGGFEVTPDVDDLNDEDGDDDNCPGNSCNAPGQNRGNDDDDEDDGEDDGDDDNCPGNSCNAPGQNRGNHGNGNGNGRGNGGGNGNGNGNGRGGRNGKLFLP